MWGNKSLIVVLCVLIGVIACNVYASESDIVQWVRLPVGEVPPIGSYGLTYYGDTDVKKQDTSLTMWNNSLVGVVPLINTAEQDLGLAGFLGIKNIHTDAILPANEVKLPNDLYDLSFGPLYRRKFANAWTGGVSLLFGSASDKLFNSTNELSFRFDAYVRIPASGENSWVAFIDYNTNRDFWRKYPIPGIGYWYKAPKKSEAFIGIPVTYLDLYPVDELEISFIYFAPTEVLAKASYAFTPSFNVYGAFQWTSELYTRADRENNDWRLNYYEKTIGAGIHWQAMKYLGVDLSAGYAFDHFFFEAKKYDDRNDNIISIENGPYVSARIGIPM